MNEQTTPPATDATLNHLRQLRQEAFYSCENDGRFSNILRETFPALLARIEGDAARIRQAEGAAKRILKLKRKEPRSGSVEEYDSSGLEYEWNAAIDAAIAALAPPAPKAGGCICKKDYGKYGDVGECSSRTVAGCAMEANATLNLKFAPKAGGCICWLGTGASSGDSATRERCPVHGLAPEQPAAGGAGLAEVLRKLIAAIDRETEMDTAVAIRLDRAARAAAAVLAQAGGAGGWVSVGKPMAWASFAPAYKHSEFDYMVFADHESARVHAESDVDGFEDGEVVPLVPVLSPAPPPARPDDAEVKQGEVKP